MDLKEFITETITGIIEATNELQEKWSDDGVIVNPPIDYKQSGVFDEGSTVNIYRQIQNVNFDVAVTAAAKTGGGGRAGLKVFSAEVGVDGTHTRQNEEISRVQFSIPLTLRASDAEGVNRGALKAAGERRAAGRANRW
ncbi:hypothetical protein [Sulfitobacter sp. M22]|jgi:hypothetical protein|uniref:hypothetical protein n=1 Tax=Sulfitobacter sp. M22 TaxID=2675332 RepID=UPI001F3D847D|nr:hypothetical protein [Sulfitobacter sp. M22]MCF7726363.1 hypothetical protein [Sulfitobacter sp. M22]